jgi:hypothetical protein
MQHFTTAPAAAAPGLDLFAAAWLERWLAHGGTMTVNPDGSGNVHCRVNASDVEGYQEPPADWPEEQRQRRMSWDNAMFIGRTRELLDLLDMVPGGRDAVKAHVRSYPSFAYAGGIVGVA